MNTATVLADDVRVGDTILRPRPHAGGKPRRWYVLAIHDRDVDRLGPRREFRLRDPYSTYAYNAFMAHDAPVDIVRSRP